MFQCIPAGSWLVCVQCDDHAAARRPSCQGGCGGGGAALLRLTGWQVLEPTVPPIPAAVRTDDELRNRRSTFHFTSHVVTPAPSH
jgi:hypothetical protein